MTYSTVPFKKAHLDLLLAAGEAEGGKMPALDAATLGFMEQQNSWTTIHGGQVLACGGTLEMWPGRYQGWAYLNQFTGAHMIHVTGITRRVISLAGPGRVEMTVRADFRKGHRWAKMLGFSVETPLLKRFGPEGEDHVGYVLFQG